MTFYIFEIYSSYILDEIQRENNQIRVVQVRLRRYKWILRGLIDIHINSTQFQ